MSIKIFKVMWVAATLFAYAALVSYDGVLPGAWENLMLLMIIVSLLIMRIFKLIWILATLSVLALTFYSLYTYDGNPDEIFIILNQGMHILSFPAGMLVSAVGYVVESVFEVEFSYFSAVLLWAGYFIIGYLQWFKLVPYLVSKLCALKSQWRGEVALGLGVLDAQASAPRRHTSKAVGSLIGTFSKNLASARAAIGKFITRDKRKQFK